MANQPQDTTRSQIKEYATELLITYGYRGLRFADIANRMGITRGNVHYHFGTKAQLAEEVIEEYVDSALSELKGILCASDTTFGTKIEQLVVYCRRRYQRFNPGPKGDNPWSLVGRLRLEVEMLSAKSRQVLSVFSSELKVYALIAVCNAKEHREFNPDAPSEVMAGQLVAIIDCAPVITQYSGLFLELEHLFYGYLRLVKYNHAERAPSFAVAASNDPKQ